MRAASTSLLRKAENGDRWGEGTNEGRAALPLRDRLALELVDEGDHLRDGGVEVGRDRRVQLDLG